MSGWPEKEDQSHIIVPSSVLARIIHKAAKNMGGDLEPGAGAPRWQTSHAGDTEPGWGPCLPGAPVWYFGHSRNSADACRSLR